MTIFSCATFRQGNKTQGNDTWSEIANNSEKGGRI